MEAYTFDGDKVEDRDIGFDPFTGTYKCVIDECVQKENSKKTGCYISIRLQVIEDGERKGRLHFENFNVVNPNEKAVQIAEQQLKQLCQACGLRGFKNCNELKDKILMVEFYVKGDEQKVKQYKSLGGNESANSASTPAETANAGSSASRPWN